MSLTWTTELPTAQGAYWRRDAGHPATAMIVYVFQPTNRGWQYVQAGVQGWRMVVDDSEWAGPIPLPTERSE